MHHMNDDFVDTRRVQDDEASRKLLELHSEKVTKRLVLDQYSISADTQGPGLGIGIRTEKLLSKHL